MDKIFKIGILVLGFGYLAYLFGVGANIDTANAQDTNQIGRYNVSMTAKGIAVIDTTNADVYVSNGNKKKLINLVTSIKKHELKR
jgi:hypothetical protein